MSAFLVVKSWDRFQHYKDRDPPWIKLYRDTFTTESWVLGTDLSRLLQLASTMLAARYSNRIPLNFKLLAKVASLDCDEASFMAAVTHLVEHNFLEIQQDEQERKHDASKPIAKCSSEAEQSRAEAEQSRAYLRAREPMLADDFEQFTQATYPPTAHRQDHITALKSAQCLIGMGKATEADLRRRLIGFRAFVDSGGYSGPEKIPTIQRWFQVHQQGESYWSKEWRALPSKAQRQQDSNLDVARRFLEAS